MEPTIEQTEDNHNEAATRTEKVLAIEEIRRRSSMHIIAFVLGLISVVGNFFWYISIPCGVLAIVFGVKSSRALASKLGKAGFILGIIGISLTIFIYISLILITFNEYYYWYY